MVATTVLTGTVEVVVTKVPKWYLLWIGKGTVTINRADFVGLTVRGVVMRVSEMRRCVLEVHYTLNGRVLTWDEACETILQPRDRLVLVDP